jgi:UDP-N-acetylmuramate: L-alanyl-gamma-D-glutamyl-meso-diaminopimelate ligase
MEKLPKHVHVIGICGVATSALAIAFHKAGVKVTGSDKGFFPPVSTELEKHGISFYAGWHPELMSKDGDPDVVMIGTASGTQNPETLYVKEHGIPSYSYPELIGKYFSKKNSIVVSGTWGKTSSSALLSHIFLSAGMDPTYMFGGISLSHETSAKLGTSDWSIFEGDEYKSSPTDTTAKFFYYKPTHLLLTAVSWDHADLYPTEDSYFAAFDKLVKGMPTEGFIVANKDNAGVKKVTDNSNKKIVWYGKNADYSYSNIEQSKNGLSFDISHADQTFKITSPLLGTFQAENITGCFAMASEFGIAAEKTIAAIASFKGMKRRLEKRLDGTTTARGITIFDDIAHSPEKALSVVRNLRGIYSGKIIAIFEPNIGGREREAATKYDNAFKDTDIVIIPRLTKLKVAEDGSAPMEGRELANTIAKTHSNTEYIEDDTALVDFLISQTKKGDCIAFLGSHGFRGMIEETVQKLR